MYVKAFDEAFSNTVIARTSYTASEIVFGEKFKIMYDATDGGDATILHIDRLDHTEKAQLPVNPLKEDTADVAPVSEELITNEPGGSFTART